MWVVAIAGALNHRTNHLSGHRLVGGEFRGDGPCLHEQLGGFAVPAWQVAGLCLVNAVEGAAVHLREGIFGELIGTSQGFLWLSEFDQLPDMLERSVSGTEVIANDQQVVPELLGGPLCQVAEPGMLGRIVCSCGGEGARKLYTTQEDEQVWLVFPLGDHAVGD